jgi:hypothetical protein
VRDNKEIDAIGAIKDNLSPEHTREKYDAHIDYHVDAVFGAQPTSLTKLLQEAKMAKTELPYDIFLNANLVSEVFLSF